MSGRKSAWTNFGAAAAIALQAAAAVAFSTDALAQKKYDTGASDTEIKIGNIAPYSGPASAYATIAKLQAAYVKMINETGGINGRKINFISYDDGYSPPKMVEQTRKLVESDEVLLLFNTLGTAGNSAIHKYVNQKGIPHIFIASGATKWADPKNYPWSMGWQPNYQTEAKVYAQYILKNHPAKTVGILYQNDDFGRDYLTGITDGLGALKSKIVISEVSFETTSPTVDSQIVQIKSANPDIVLTFTTPKFAAQSIKKIGELKWTPVHIISNTSAQVSATLKPAGFDNSQGVISAAYLKDPVDPTWKDDKAILEWREFMRKWYPEGDLADSSNIYAYTTMQGLVQVIKQCGDDLTRANVIKQMANLKMEVGVMLPGIKVTTSDSDFVPIEQLQLMRFRGESWELFGEMLGGSAAN